MVEWLLSKGADPNAKDDRGDAASLLAARVGIPSTLNLLVKAGAKEVDEEWPKPAGGALSMDTAVKRSGRGVMLTCETAQPNVSFYESTSCQAPGDLSSLSKKLPPERAPQYPGSPRRRRRN